MAAMKSNPNAITILIINDAGIQNPINQPTILEQPESIIYSFILPTLITRKVKSKKVNTKDIA